MVAVAQLARAPDCGSGGRGFETHQPPLVGLSLKFESPFLFLFAKFVSLSIIMKQVKRKTVIGAVKSVDRKLEIEQFGKLISTRPTRIAKSKKCYDRKSVKRQLKALLRDR